MRAVEHMSRATAGFRSLFMRRMKADTGISLSVHTTPSLRDLNSSMSSDALLMNVFCTPGVIDSTSMRRMLGITSGDEPIFGWKARVPLTSGRFDRTEVDMRWGDLLVEAKLTESDFQCRETSFVEAYRDFEQVYDCELLTRIRMRTRRRRDAVEL